MLKVQKEMHETVRCYVKKINSDPLKLENIEDLLIILRYVGLSIFSFGKVDVEKFSTVNINFQTDHYYLASFLEPTEVKIRLGYLSQLKIPQAPRVPVGHPEMEDWEEIVGGIYDWLLDLVYKAIDVEAILTAKETFPINAAPTIPWDSIGRKLQSWASNLISHLMGNKSHFYMVAGDVLDLLKEYSFIPEDSALYRFLKEVTGIRESYAKDFSYRKVFLPEEARRIYG